MASRSIDDANFIRLSRRVQIDFGALSYEEKARAMEPRTEWLLRGELSFPVYFLLGWTLLGRDGILKCAKAQIPGDFLRKLITASPGALSDAAMEAIREILDVTQENAA